MKTLLAAALLLTASSLVTAHAEWEILDPGMPGNAQAASPVPLPSSIAPTTSRTVAAQPLSSTKCAVGSRPFRSFRRGRERGHAPAAASTGIAC